MKTKKKSAAVDAQLMKVFTDIYSDTEAKKALRDAKKAFKMIKHDPIFFKSTQLW